MMAMNRKKHCSKTSVRNWPEATRFSLGRSCLQRYRASGFPNIKV